MLTLHSFCFSMDHRQLSTEYIVSQVRKADNELSEPYHHYLTAEQKFAYVQEYYKLNQHMPQPLKDLFSDHIKQAQDKKNQIESLKLQLIRHEMPTNHDSLQDFKNTATYCACYMNEFYEMTTNGYEQVQLLLQKSKREKQQA